MRWIISVIALLWFENGFSYLCDQTSLYLSSENSLVACGEGIHALRSQAEEKAYSDAITKINQYCETSANCHNRDRMITPMRVDCKFKHHLYYCNRRLDVDLISKSTYSLEMNGTFFTRMSFFSHPFFAASDMELGVGAGTEFNKFGFRFNFAYRTSKIDESYFYTDENRSLNIGSTLSNEYSGFAYGFSFFFKVQKFKIELTQSSSSLNQNSSYELNNGMPRTFDILHQQVFINRELGSNWSFGFGVGHYYNSLAIQTNSYGIQFDYNF